MSLTLEQPDQAGGAPDGAGVDDLSALSWVQGELRRSLEAAHKALRRHLKEADAAAGSDVSSVDPSVLRNARAQLHQGVGALQMVGQAQAALLLQASEAALQRMVSRPAIADAAAVETVEKASFALLDFLARKLARKDVSPVMLFPQYRATRQLAGIERIHPADLWPVHWEWHELSPDVRAQPRAINDATRAAMETQVLALMRVGTEGAGHDALMQMSDLCADLGAGALQSSFGGPQLATFWQLAAAVFEAQANGLLQPDTYSKRLASGMLAQLRLRMRGPAEVPQRLAQDLLFFCSHARAPQDPTQSPRLAAVRHAWQLQDWPTADYENAQLGRHDPALLAQARKRVAQARDAWSAVAGGEMHRMGSLSELFQLMGESLRRLFPEGETLNVALQAAVAQTLGAAAEPPPALAMEVATAILYVDASLEDAQLDHSELPQRVQRLARRIDDVRIGAEPQPLEVWMEELYRRVSDRQTMGSVVQELRASLSEIEGQIDQYFRDPAKREVLIPVPAQLSAMRGVLSVLGMDQASQAALHMRDDVEALAQTEVDPQMAIRAGTFDRLADNLGALSFLIDMLSVQPQLAKSLFRFDPETGLFSATMGQSARVSAFADLDDGGPLQLDLRQSVQPLPPPPAAPAASLDLTRFVSETTIALVPKSRTSGGVPSPVAMPSLDSSMAPVLPPRPEPAAPVTPGAPDALAMPPAAGADTGLEDDPEMREIFIEEAQEVIADAKAALDRLADVPDTPADLTAVRRAFHTLKGSSRMIGLREFGEAAWAFEQLYNDRLASAPRVDSPLRTLTVEALDYLSDWTDAIERQQPAGHRAADVAQAADLLRLKGERVAIPLPGSAATDSPEPAPSLSDELPELLSLEDAPSQHDADVAAALPDLPQLPELPDLPDLQPAPVAAPSPFDDLAIPSPVSFEATITLPAHESPAAPQPAEIVDGDLLHLDLDLPDEAKPSAEFEDDDLQPLPLLDGVESLPPLQVKVPGLPSAADLELGGTLAQSAPEPADEPRFALDLGDLDGLSQPMVSEPPAAYDLPSSPLPEGEVQELALDDLGSMFPDSSPAPLLTPDAAPVEQPLADALAEMPAAGPADEAVAELLAAPIVEPVPEQAAAADADDEDDEQVKVIGPLRISIPLFNIFLNEADEQSRRLCTELAEWSLEWQRHPVPDSTAALAHTLAGNSATVGYSELSALARALEHALIRSHANGRGRVTEADLFSDAAEDIRRLLHQFAAGFLRSVAPELMQRLADHERLAVDSSGVPPAGGMAAAQAGALASMADIDAVDAIDEELFPIFEEEADELLPQLQSRLREWLERPGDADAAMACMRTLHTLKGGARLAGAMRIGEMAHTLETAIEDLGDRGHPQPAEIETLLSRADAMSEAFDALRQRGAVAPAGVPAPVQVPVPVPTAVALPKPLPEPTEPAAPVQIAEPAEPVVVEPVADEAIGIASSDVVPEPPPPIAPPPPSTLADPIAAEAGVELPHQIAPLPPTPRQAPAVPVLKAQHVQPLLHPSAIAWQRFPVDEAAPAVAAAVQGERPAAIGAGAVVRVRAGLLDRLVNQAGEVSITRARIDSDVHALQASLGELTESLERMRRQLRDIELQAETQITSRIEAAKAAAQSFDPLEMDRFTRFQELTRFMAESVNDVATLQRSLQRTLQSTEDELAGQARLTRELQDDLLRTRMIEFDSLSERLFRTARQAAKETGKQVKVEVVGGAIEVDRGVLERMVGPFEHLLRNCVAHGIEMPGARAAAGKDATGVVTITVAQAGNEVAVEFADDGAGLDLARIRQRGIERGLISADAPADQATLAGLIFAPGFSTAAAVTELAGRGVGLDVVRAEVNAMGGRVETLSEPGRGTRFKLLLPLTTAVTQVVMLRCGDLQVATPSPLIEIVRRTNTEDVERAYDQGRFEYAGEMVPFYWLPALLRVGSRPESIGRTQTVVIVRSASQRVAVHVDEVMGNQEVVVKNVGPQLSRLPGLAGVTLLPSGAVALIYNPVALSALYGDEARQRQRTAGGDVSSAGSLPGNEHAPLAPLVMVVDDSLTVRRVTQRLLSREGYRVVLAKDGMEALEKLTEELPVVVLSDIEMPRMDGFDLVRNLRADERLAPLPVVMITSRIAQKHREYAAELGVQHYLGKPYSEDELLLLVARYAQQVSGSATGPAAAFVPGAVPG